MLHAQRSHHHAQAIDSQKVASHLEESVTELKDENCIVEFDTVDTTHIERSVFYRDDHKRVYHLNPKEHPAITGAVDSVVEQIASNHGLELIRSDPTDGFVIAVTMSCEECSVDDVTDVTDAPNTTHYPEGVIEKLTECPFHDRGESCADVQRAGAAVVETVGGRNLSSEEFSVVADLQKTPVPKTSVSYETESRDDIECSKLSFTQSGVDPVLAKLLGVLDVIAYVRTHPSIKTGKLDCYPELISDIDPTSDTTQSTEFKNHCEDFIMETSPGWRLRWILEVVDDDPKPLENIAAAANVPIIEVKLTTRLLEEWDIVTFSEMNGMTRCQLSQGYVEWRQSVGKTGVENTEPAYLAENGDATQIIEQSYQALTQKSL